MAWGRNLLPLGLGKKERDGALKERLGDKEGKGKRGKKEEKRTALPSLHFHQKGWKEGAEERGWKSKFYVVTPDPVAIRSQDRKSTRLNSSH